MILIKSYSIPPVLIMWNDDCQFLAEQVDLALHDFDLHAMITSGIEGTHVRASKHYRGQALDFRKVWSPTLQTKILQSITARLGAHGRYILESDHLHTEII
jgi:hypothetical protein